MFCLMTRLIQSNFFFFFFFKSNVYKTVSPPLPVNGSKSVEVVYHDAVKVSEAIHFPEVVQVKHPILPQSRNLIKRPDDAATLRVRLSDHRHTAAAAHT